MADTQCGNAADVALVTTITVTGSTGNETMTIDQSGAGGVFPDGANFTVDMGAGTGDALVITGDDLADTITFGTTAINLDNTGTNDVTPNRHRTLYRQCGGGQRYCLRCRRRNAHHG